MHRTFIAIPIPIGARTALRSFVKKLQEIMPEEAFAFLGPESWHITLSFLGNQDDEGVGRVVSALPSITPMLTVPAEIVFERIIYSPNADDPSMIVAVGSETASAQLEEMRDALEDGLIAHEARFRPDNRRFMAHITLARRTKVSVVLPEVNESVRVVVFPEFLNIYESVMAKGERHYELLASEALDRV